MNAFRWILILISENARLIRAALRYSPQYWQRIHSPSWYALKNEVVRAQGGRCYDCGSIALLELHHLHYKNLWHEQWQRDVVGLCKQCHCAADNARKKGQRHHATT